VNPIQNRKKTQETLDTDFEKSIVRSADISQFDPAYAAEFLRKNCTKKSGDLNGNLTRTVRNFVKLFGKENFDKVLSDYYVNHSTESFPRWAFLLDRPEGKCTECGSTASFVSYKDGFRRTCSSVCGNRLTDKLHTIRSKMLNPSSESLLARKQRAKELRSAAILDQAAVIASEGKFDILRVEDTEVVQVSAIRYEFGCKTCNSKFVSSFEYRRCYTCAPKQFQVEDEIAALFPNCTVRTKQRSVFSSDRRLELDVYLPDHNIAVELDGVLWHSFGRFPEFLNNEDVENEKKYRHERKSDLCRERGIDLFAVLDVEWNDPTKKKIWESMLLSRVGKTRSIHARKCRVEAVRPSEAREFLEANHLQGACQHSRAIGLRYGDDLVALMTFGRPRFNKNADVELLRYCNLIGTRVVGGGSRILTTFARENAGKRIISYANKRWSNGKFYLALGFSELTHSRPNYYYFLPPTGKPIHRMMFQKHKLHKVLENFDKHKTETDNMFAAGYRRIWDYGHIVYERTL
jgi:hypothetical protein